MKITVVLVLYQQKPEDSKTFQTLKKYLFPNAEDCKKVELILYDNSVEKHEFDPLTYEGIRIFYHHDRRNLGIAAAYNYAWAKAIENGSDWLLLLDHDTELTSGYIGEVMNLKNSSKDVVAVVPKIISDNKLISPVYSHSLRPLTDEKPTAGLQEKPVMAINSGAMIRVGFLNEIGGFNESFPLDYLDHWLFYEIYLRGRKVCLLDVTLEHELSVLDYNRVSLARYQSILNSEMNFYKNYKKDLYSSYRKQLALRFVKQALTVRNKKIAMFTLRKLFSM